MNKLDGRHNHAPVCCCVFRPEDPCPACPKHGELAQGVECPQCHQPIGRPHTEFCTLDPDRVWPAGHLVHSEAFIDQDDPRYTPPVGPSASQAGLCPRCFHTAHHGECLACYCRATSPDSP